jgi:starch-binding outer membrane protein, SusD/RagB family
MNSQPDRAMTIRRTLRGATLLGMVALAGTSLGACRDTLLTESPKDILVPENLYMTPAGFRNGLNGLYQNVRREGRGFNDGDDLRTIPWTIGVDNAWSNWRTGNTDIYNDWGSLNNPQAQPYADLWRLMYETINNANAIVERAENPEVRWTAAERNVVIGEARFIRAWAYRHLVYLFGGVPITLEESTGANIRTDWQRASRDEVWAQIEQDLLFAEQHLPAVPAADGRAGRGAAQHYLAELYLVSNQPAQAEAKAAALINSGSHRLITQRYGVRASQPGVPFMDMFRDGNANRSQGNTEALWVLQYQLNTSGGGQHIHRRFWVNRVYNVPGLNFSEEYGGRGIGRYSPTRWALQIYDPADDRGSHHAIRRFYQYNNPITLPAGRRLGDTIWTVVGQEAFFLPLWPTTNKWDYMDPLNPTNNNSYNDVIYLRLGETYLLLAEAQMKQGKLAEAAATINVLRDRAKAPRVTAAEIDLEFILDERSRELFAEEQRRYTLLRTGTWLERTRRHNPIAGPNITARDTIFPIPQPVIDANLTAPMPQNPGY